MRGRNRAATLLPIRRVLGIVAAAGVLVLAVVAVLLLRAGSTGPAADPVVGAEVGAEVAPQAPREGGTRPSTGVRPVLSPPPNVVLVLMDDFSMDLLPTMPNAARMRRLGAAYEHSYVVDSLCCVSRASLLTGQYPHQTGVLTNTANTPNPVGPVGGWEAFESYGNQARSFPVRLQAAGYTTGFVGKFLNQYEIRDGVVPPLPPGWDAWHVLFGSAYDGWGFASTYVEDGALRVRRHDAPWSGASAEEKDAAYAGAVTTDLALQFLREHADDPAPYFLQVSPYATHGRLGSDTAYPGDPLFPPAFRDRPGGDQPLGNCGRLACDALGLDDLVGVGDDQADNAPRYADGSPAPDWRGPDPGLSEATALTDLRNRARMAQSADRMLGEILDAVDANTYVVFTSDNGFHLRQHGLGRGKGTPFVSDVQVPLLVVGPGVVPGTRAEVVSNLDLAPTVEELAGLRPAGYRAGTSLVPTFDDLAVDRRDLTFFEHTYAPSLGLDPDAVYSGGKMDVIPSFVAVRSRDALLVRLDLDPSWEGVEHAWEFYDYREAAFERTNTFADPSRPAELSRLRRALVAFDDCGTITGDQRVPARCRALTADPS